MANDVTDALYAALCAMKIASGLPRVDAEYDFGPAIASVEAALAARPLPEGMETTAESREEARRYAQSITSTLVAHYGERQFAGACLSILRDFDRLTARLAASEAEKAEVRKLLARCHDRIHVLPRTSDTELASRIEAMLGRLK